MNQRGALSQSEKTVYLLRRPVADSIAIIVSSKNNRLALLRIAYRLGVANQLRIVTPQYETAPPAFVEDLVKVPGKRPWFDARPIEKKSHEIDLLTIEAIERAAREMAAQTLKPRYVYRTSAEGKSLMAFCRYFMGTGIVVEDGRGNLWLNGQPYEGNIY